VNKIDKFEKALQGKLKAEPDRNFDQRFWAKFDREFGQRSKTGFPRFRFQWISAFAAMIALMIGSYEWYRASDISPGEATLVTQILETEELLEDVELLAELDQMPESEEEWGVLEEGLEEGGAAHDIEKS
jgi:hypothetical protein